MLGGFVDRRAHEGFCRAWAGALFLKRKGFSAPSRQPNLFPPPSSLCVVRCPLPHRIRPFRPFAVRSHVHMRTTAAPERLQLFLRRLLRRLRRLLHLDVGLLLFALHRLVQRVLRQPPGELVERELALQSGIPHRWWPIKIVAQVRFGGGAYALVACNHHGVSWGPHWWMWGTLHALV